MQGGGIMVRRAVVVAVLLAAPSAGAWAAPTACPEDFLDGEAPDLVATDGPQKVQDLCYLQYAVLFSAATRTPLWSAEHLTREHIEAAQGLKRSNSFHAEERLTSDDRSELADFKGSGYDRGHLSPSGDFGDMQAQRESYSLANIVPQDPNDNRGIWARLEGAVRELAENEGQLYVVTGPAFDLAHQQRIHDRVAVPIKIWKAVFDPAKQAAGVYLVDNAPGSEWQVISLTELRALTGLDVFPKLDQSIKDHAMALPGPVRRPPWQRVRNAGTSDQPVTTGAEP